MWLMVSDGKSTLGISSDTTYEAAHIEWLKNADLIVPATRVRDILLEHTLHLLYLDLNLSVGYFLYWPLYCYVFTSIATSISISGTCICHVLCYASVNMHYIHKDIRTLNSPLL